MTSRASIKPQGRKLRSASSTRGLNASLGVSNSDFRLGYSNNRDHYKAGTTTYGHRSSNCAPSYSRRSLHESSSSKSVSSLKRRLDAREIFHDYGISEPVGWLSEGSGIEEPRALSESQANKVCHSCQVRLVFQSQCATCGHGACVKCASLGLFPPPEDSANCQPRPLRSKLSYDIKNNQESDKSFQPNPFLAQEQGRKGSASGMTPTPEQCSPVDTQLDHTAVPPSANKRMPRRAKSIAMLKTVKNNPFLQADRSSKTLASEPQVSSKHAHARSPERLSDCVPRRHMDRSYSDTRSPCQCDNTAREASVLAQIQELPNTKRDEEGEALDKAELVQVETAIQCPTTSEAPRTNYALTDPLGVKIKQLYEHSQELYRSQHILQHLATGANNLVAEPANQQMASKFNRLRAL
jgi:hypothetical protein